MMKLSYAIHIQIKNTQVKDAISSSQKKGYLKRIILPKFRVLEKLNIRSEKGYKVDE